MGRGRTAATSAAQALALAPVGASANGNARRIGGHSHGARNVLSSVQAKAAGRCSGAASLDIACPGCPGALTRTAVYAGAAPGRAPMARHELTRGLAAETLEVARQMTLIEESDVGRDMRAGNAREQEPLRGSNAQTAQVAMRRFSEALTKCRGETRDRQRPHLRQLRHRERFVDVRDVADLHGRAMTHPAAKGERLLAIAGDSLWMSEVAKVLRRRMGRAGSKVSTWELPNWLVRVAARRNLGWKGIARLLGSTMSAKSETAIRLPGWPPSSSEVAIVATAESLIRFGLLHKSKEAEQGTTFGMNSLIKPEAAPRVLCRVAAGASMGDRKCHQEPGHHVVGGDGCHQLHDFLRVESHPDALHQVIWHVHVSRHPIRQLDDEALNLCEQSRVDDARVSKRLDGVRRHAGGDRVRDVCIEFVAGTIQHGDSQNGDFPQVARDRASISNG